ncbi:FIMAH domain-containing protein [Pseudactinotalea sp. Z1732]|uniref:FIMAH domain-containing protein n=1 Tax=Micrococcales TaxID=85006 RepID=UPI003C7C1044
MARSRSRLTRTGSVAAAAALALAGFTASPAVADDEDFRVQPYLQNPATDGMLITWMSWDDEPGEVQLEGQDPIESDPEVQEALDWTDNNRQQAIDHPEWGDWFREGRNYRHQVQLSDLEPDTTYTYTVRQGTSEITNTFTTAPTSDDWENIRLVAMADSETDPAGRTSHREWVPGAIAEGSERPSVTDSLWAERFGTTEQQGEEILQYALTEDQGFAYNMEIVTERDPDLMLFAGDLVQGGGFQPAWDEWFRYLAGEVGNPASSRPVVTALGNWEPFGASDGGYEIEAVMNGRDSFHSYFTPFPNGTPEHQGNYHRLDYGPLTVITLDSTKGIPDDHPDNYAEEDKLSGIEYDGPGPDTQSSYTSTEYIAAGGDNLSPYNEGSIQWNWAEDQLADAREQGQIIVVQFHHAPYSSGEHGLPMNHEDTSGQGGTPMRIYSEMFEQYGVAAVLSGHSEMFERSLVDLTGDGNAVNYYDVGVAGDGLRGERRANGNLLSEPILEYNPYRVWSADQFEPEIWDGETLVDGGKHYGHLEINIERDADGGATMSLTPVYSFPLLDDDLDVLGTERRIYDDEVSLAIGADGTVEPEERDAVDAVADLATALQEYVDAGDVAGPIANQLENALRQAEQHLEGDRTNPARVAMERFVRHLDNPKRPDTLTEQAAEDLRVQAMSVLDLI